MGALVLACGIPNTGFRDPAWWEVPTIPGKSDLDPPLAEGPDRVVVVGTDAGLAAVVLRLLRTDRLDLPVGYWPRHRERSTVARLWGLPDDDGLSFACDDGAPVPIPLIRDDAGGVLVGRGTIGPVHGEAYCDDQLALRGLARSIEVTPDPAGVRGRVLRGGLLGRAKAYRGRAFQVGCHPATLTSDGVLHPRAVTRWTWYRHTEDLRAIALPV